MLFKIVERVLHLTNKLSLAFNVLINEILSLDGVSCFNSGDS